MAYKVLVICGSPRPKGCTNRALERTAAASLTTASIRRPSFWSRRTAC